MEEKVKTTTKASTDANAVKEVKKLVAGRNLSWEQVQKLPKVVCQIEKRTSKSGVAIYTLKTIVRQNIVLKDTLEEKVAQAICIKNNLNLFNPAAKEEFRRFSGYIQFGHGISKLGNEYYTYSVYTCDIHHSDNRLDEFDMTLIQNEATKEEHPLKITWLEYDADVDLETFGRNYEVEE